MGTAGGTRQNGMSCSVLSPASSLKGLSPSSFGSAAFDDSAGLAPLPFLGGPRNLSV